MALQSNGPILLSLPPFRGVTRKLVLAGIALFFVQILLNIFFPAPPAGTMMTILVPHYALRGWVWQFVTYAFASGGLLNTALGLLSVWFFGSALEDRRGGRWLAEYFFTATIGGGLLAALLSLLPIPGISQFQSVFGMWPAILALLLAFARQDPHAELRLYFVLRVKAKHLAAIFILFYFFAVLLSHDRLSALTALCVALCGFLFLRFVPRSGLSFAASESWYGLRNAFYRRKRQRAAKQFTVYMRKQGKNVPSDFADTKPSDKKDKRWMN